MDIRLSSWKNARNVGYSALAFVGLLSLSGCAGQGADEAKYPLRNDLLINSPIMEVSPERFDRPGQFDSSGAQLVLLTQMSENEDRIQKDAKLSTEEREKKVEELRELRKTILKGLRDPKNLSDTQKQRLETELTKAFGTPRRPLVLNDFVAANGEKSEDDAELKKTADLKKMLRQLQLDTHTLAEGRRLYRSLCQQCHGLTGNGRGTAATWLTPHPRDYRNGIFKFTSSNQPDKIRKPLREDLLRTLRKGIDGTSMPSFGILPEKDLNALASYVMHLSIRGQTEYTVMEAMLREVDPLAEEDLSDMVKETAVEILQRWKQAENAGLQLPYTDRANVESEKEFAESVKRGFDLFQKGGAGCIGCHVNYGRDDRFLNDSWGTFVRAADLTKGVYRGGHRPEDLFWRIRTGINGANMPASQIISDKDVWDLVHFLQVLPYPEKLEKYQIQLKP